jgi:hypothetical protein
VRGSTCVLAHDLLEVGRPSIGIRGARHAREPVSASLARRGFGLHYARSRRAERLELLLLITALEALAYWLAVLAAETRQ